MCRQRRRNTIFGQLSKKRKKKKQKKLSPNKRHKARAPENVDSPAWSPLGRRGAKQASPSAGRFLCHSRRRCDDDDDKATKTSSRQRAGGSRAKRGGQHRVETEERGARVEKAGREEERRQCEAQDEQRRHEVAGQAEAEARRAGQT